MISHFRSIASNILDIMIDLKIEDDYIQKKILEKRESVNALLESQQAAKLAREIKLQGLVNARVSRRQIEKERCVRIGNQIIEDGDECYAEYGYHIFQRKGGGYFEEWNYSCQNHHLPSRVRRCQRCGITHKYEGGYIKKPAIVGRYCDCERCIKFVGSKSPYVKIDLPADWVIDAFWQNDQLYAQ